MTRFVVSFSFNVENITFSFAIKLREKKGKLLSVKGDLTFNHRSCLRSFHFLISFPIHPTKYNVCNCTSVTTRIAAPLLLKRYYLATKMNMDKAKRLIESSYKLRNSHPHIFFERDPLAPEIELSLRIT